MAFLRFLSRVAFICNICYLLASLIQWLPVQIPDSGLVSDIAVLGWVVAIALNVILTFILVIVFVVGKLRNTGIPIWLMIMNFLFLLIQATVLILQFPKK